MSFVLAMPEVLGSAATDLAALGSVLGAADAAAAATTTGIVAAAQDEVSAAIAALFSAHGRAYQVASAQAAAVHAQFVEALSAQGPDRAHAGPPSRRSPLKLGQP
ncbi:PE-PGRS family protein [Mycobacterium tuberculosis]|nr:PE-PGRS family protein [Mycobacterium tuberculosis]